MHTECTLSQLETDQLFGKSVISSAIPLPNLYLLTPSPTNGPIPIAQQTNHRSNGFQNVIKHKTNKKKMRQW